MRQKIIDFLIEQGAEDTTAKDKGKEQAESPTGKRVYKIHKTQKSYYKFSIDYYGHTSVFVFGNFGKQSQMVDFDDFFEFYKTLKK